MVMGSCLVEFSINENCTCDWITLAENCHKVCSSENIFWIFCKKLVSSMDSNRNRDNGCSSSLASRSQLCSASTIANCSQLSSIPSMEEKPGPTLVYHRRKPQSKTLSMSVSSIQSSARLGDGCLSYLGSEPPSKAAADMHKCSEVVGKDAFNISSESNNGRFVVENDFCCVNDSYSSSKSNEELGSIPLRVEADENGECSSSSGLVLEGLQDNLSGGDKCISIIRNQWLSDGLWPFKVKSSNGNTCTTSYSSCRRICKVCQIQERSVEMLICDQCDEAYHVSCCNVKKIPIGEWFCCFCLKKQKILMQHNRDEVGTLEGAISEENLGPIASMLIGVGLYIPGVRIGRQFQADVPDWSGPSLDEKDVTKEPVELEPSECVGLHGQNKSKHPRISSIGNWIQCRQVIDGMGDDGDEIICGKWRRAPLFEVQTDNWECFCSVHWDPFHADCAVPQELETDEVLKQLKYVEMLRPRLMAKRSKLDQAKDVCPRDNLKDSKRAQIS